jgi:predicted methyltransferase
MRKLLIISACAALTALAAVQVQAADTKPAKAEKTMAVPAYVKAAVEDSSRPKADTDVDQFRKPGETIAFAGIKPGSSVLEILPGGGYFTRLFAKVVGPKGHVYAVARPAGPGRGGAAPATPAAKTIADASGGVVTYTEGSLSSLSTPSPVDFVWTSRNYHDLNAADRAGLNQAAFSVLKPGGTYIILDHSAVVGTGDFAMNQPGGPSQALHRIDENLVKLEVMKAGFKLVGESDLLRNPKDTRTTRVFDAAIRGDTDQFILKFEKPKK